MIQIVATALLSKRSTSQESQLFKSGFVSGPPRERESSKAGVAQLTVMKSQVHCILDVASFLEFFSRAAGLSQNTWSKPAKRGWGPGIELVKLE